MAEPKKKSSSTRSANRRAHRALKSQQGSKCQNCGAQVMSHRVCSNCGHYKGKKIYEVK